MEGYEIHEKMLQLYIYDHLVKRNMRSVAETFATESGLDTSEPIIDTPEGYLREWFEVFWDSWSSKTWAKRSRRPPQAAMRGGSMMPAGGLLNVPTGGFIVSGSTRRGGSAPPPRNPSPTMTMPHHIHMGQQQQHGNIPTAPTARSGGHTLPPMQYNLGHYSGSQGNAAAGGYNYNQTGTSNSSSAPATHDSDVHPHISHQHLNQN